MLPKSERFELRLDQQTLDEVDEWRSDQRDVPSRAEAIRRLVETGLSQSRSQPEPVIRISDGEKLALFMLRDIYRHLKIKGDIDPEFLADVITGGHYWGLEWQHTGIFHGHVDSKQVLSEVVDILDMWSFLESGYKSLSVEEQAVVEIEASPFGKNVHFLGFDGNNEAEHMGVAHFLIDKLDRFSSFKGRSLNSHSPTLDSYKRMLAAFSPLRAGILGRELRASEIVAVLKERIHPQYRNKSASR